MVDASRIFRECLLVPAKFSVMLQIMHSHLEMVLDEFLAQFAGDPVISLGDKIERGTEAQFFLQFHQLTAFFQAVGTFNVVGEHQRETFPVSPAQPAVWHLASGFVGGPYVFANRALTPGYNSTHGHTKPPRQIRFETIIKTSDGLWPVNPRHLR